MEKVLTWQADSINYMNYKEKKRIMQMISPKNGKKKENYKKSPGITATM